MNTETKQFKESDCLKHGNNGLLDNPEQEL